MPDCNLCDWDGVPLRTSYDKTHELRVRHLMEHQVEEARRLNNILERILWALAPTLTTTPYQPREETPAGDTEPGPDAAPEPDEVPLGIGGTSAHSAVRCAVCGFPVSSPHHLNRCAA